MTIAEYLQQNKNIINKNIPIELKDIIDDRGIYCKGYNDLVNELSLIGYEHIITARYIDTQETENKIVIFYMKDTNNYTNFDLMQLTEKLQGSEL